MGNVERKVQIDPSTGKKALFCSFPCFFSNIRGFKAQQIWSLASRPQRMRIARTSTLTEMPEIDHRVRQSFQGVVQFANPLEAHQQTPKLIFPSEDSFDSLKLFLNNGWVENGFAPPLRCLSTTRIFRNIRNHAAIEDGFAVGATIIDPIQADDGLVQVESDLFGDASHFRQRLLQQRRFVPVAGSRNKRTTG
jgi:hypothetical protein